MKRVRRNLINMLTAISLILALATVALWVRSGWCFDETWCVRQRLHSNGDRSVQILLGRSTRGVVTLKLFDDVYKAGTQHSESWEPSPEGLRFGRKSGSLDHTFWQRIPLPRWHFRQDTWNDPPDQWQGVHRGFNVSFPIWLPLGLFLIVPAVRLIRVSRFWIPSGLCPACGYDTRANPAKCSECGHEPALAAAAKREELTP